MKPVAALGLLTGWGGTTVSAALPPTSCGQYDTKPGAACALRYAIAAAQSPGGAEAAGPKHPVETIASSDTATTVVSVVVTRLVGSRAIGKPFSHSTLERVNVFERAG